jgi:hypothetical protein
MMTDGRLLLTHDEEIAEIMRTTYLDRGSAEEAVAERHGEAVYGIETLQPLTAEERRAIGRSRPMEEVMIELGEAESYDGTDDDALLTELGLIDSRRVGSRTRRSIFFLCPATARIGVRRSLRLDVIADRKP